MRKTALGVAIAPGIMTRTPQAANIVEIAQDAGTFNTLAVSKSDSGVTVDQANVVTANIAASNGVVHVIDKVMLPDS